MGFFYYFKSIIYPLWKDLQVLLPDVPQCGSLHRVHCGEFWQAIRSQGPGLEYRLSSECSNIWIFYCLWHVLGVMYGHPSSYRHSEVYNVQLRPIRQTRSECTNNVSLISGLHVISVYFANILNNSSPFSYIISACNPRNTLIQTSFMTFKKVIMGFYYLAGSLVKFSLKCWLGIYGLMG